MSTDESREQRAERLYAQAETSLEAMKAQRVQRGPQVLIGVLVVLTLGVGVVVATDLRRLKTPTGTALAWTGAAIFGDCRQYDRLSVPAPGTQPDVRSAAERCRDLSAVTAGARESSSVFGIELLSVQQSGRQATATVRVTTPDGVSEAPLQLVRVDDGWAVVRTPQACRTAGCA